MAYADYTYYEEVFSGSSISPEAFPGLAFRASGYIDTATMGRAKNALGDVALAVKNCCCALCEIIQDEQRLYSAAYSAEPQVQSESVGSWSKSYRASTATAADMEAIEGRKKAALLQWLGATGLLQARAYFARGSHP